MDGRENVTAEGNKRQLWRLIKKQIEYSLVTT